MRSVNKVLLIGNVVADPEVNTTTNGHKMTKFSIATNRDWKGADGERHQAADFHRVVAWRKLGEICGEYLKKGAGVYIEGRLMTHKFQDKEGNNRSYTEIVADSINFLTFKQNKEQDEVNLIEVAA